MWDFVSLTSNKGVKCSKICESKVVRDTSYNFMQRPEKKCLLSLPLKLWAVCVERPQPSRTFPEYVSCLHASQGVCETTWLREFAIHREAVRNCSCEAWKDWIPLPDWELWVLSHNVHQSPCKEISP